jgi:DNA polymerase (family 10)
MTNKQIAEIFSKTADLLEIKGENPFKIRAYRNAARIIENSAKDFNKLVKENFDLTKLPGIGKDISEYIKEIVTTGKFKKLETLQKEIPQGLVELLSIEGLGPKRVKLLYDVYGIKDMNSLQEYAVKEDLTKLPGFGPKLVEKILKGVKQLKKAGIRFLWAEAEPVARELKEYLESFEGVEIVEVAGSFRRKKESVGDLDILVVAKDYTKVSERFTEFDKVKEVYSKGLTRSTVFLQNGLQVDLRAVAKGSYGAALHYFTGSKAHNIEIRKIAIDLGMKINEYGVYKGNKKIASLKEEDIYESVGLAYIPPELRENRGEIEAAKKNELPNLVNYGDIKGVLEFFANSEEVKKAVSDLKGDYLIACLEYNDSFFKTKDCLRSFKNVIIGIKADIDEKGDFDIPADVLNSADFLAGFMKKCGLNRDEQTKRYIKVLNNPNVKILLRPSLRIVLKNDETDLDWDAVFECAAENGKILEINSNPKFLDLSDVLIKSAIKSGVKLVLSNYNHDFKYGLYQARRGWCEKKDLINTFEFERIKKFLES